MIIHQAHNSVGNFHFNRKIFQKELVFLPHHHKAFELLYVIKGSFPLQVGLEKFTLEPGDLILLPPYVIHTFPVHLGEQIWVGTFSADYIQSFADKHSDILYSPFRCDGDIEVFLRTHLFTNEKTDRCMAQACLYLVCAQCLKYGKALCQVDFNRILGITSYISDHLTENFTMAQLAQELNYDYHYMSRIFRQLFGMHFKDFVNLYRVDEACRLLTQSQSDISSIALSCGFQTVRSFNRAFLAIMNQTPSQYRNAQAKS